MRWSAWGAGPDVAEIGMILTKWHLVCDKNSQLLERKSWACNRGKRNTCKRGKRAEEAETLDEHYISR